MNTLSNIHICMYPIPCDHKSYVFFKKYFLLFLKNQLDVKLFISVFPFVKVHLFYFYFDEMQKKSGNSHVIFFHFPPKKLPLYALFFWHFLQNFDKRGVVTPPPLTLTNVKVFLKSSLS